MDESKIREAILHDDDTIIDDLLSQYSIPTTIGVIRFPVPLLSSRVLLFDDFWKWCLEARATKLCTRLIAMFRLCAIYIRLEKEKDFKSIRFLLDCDKNPILNASLISLQYLLTKGQLLEKDVRYSSVSLWYLLTTGVSFLPLLPDTDPRLLSLSIVPEAGKFSINHWPAEYREEYFRYDNFDFYRFSEPTVIGFERRYLEQLCCFEALLYQGSIQDRKLAAANLTYLLNECGDELITGKYLNLIKKLRLE
jgi:hypothetical protein